MALNLDRLLSDEERAKVREIATFLEGSSEADLADMWANAEITCRDPDSTPQDETDAWFISSAIRDLDQGVDPRPTMEFLLGCRRHAVARQQEIARVWEFVRGARG